MVISLPPPAIPVRRRWRVSTMCPAPGSWCSYRRGRVAGAGGTQMVTQEGGNVRVCAIWGTSMMRRPA